MNGSTFVKELTTLIVEILIDISTLTGVYVLVWLFCPSSVGREPWYYLWRPLVLRSTSGWPRVYWLGWIRRRQKLFGSCSETAIWTWAYDAESFHRGVL